MRLTRSAPARGRDGDPDRVLLRADHRPGPRRHPDSLDALLHRNDRAAKHLAGNQLAVPGDDREPELIGVAKAVDEKVGQDGVGHLAVDQRDIVVHRPRPVDLAPHALDEEAAPLAAHLNRRHVGAGGGEVCIQDAHVTRNHRARDTATRHRNLTPRWSDRTGPESARCRR